MTLRFVAFVLVALAAVPAQAANVLVMSNSGQDFVAGDFALNTSHVFDSWDADVTPTVDDLLAYDAVLLFENGNFPNAGAIGDVVAQYAEQGGGVVTATFFLQDYNASGWGLLEPYDPFVPSGGGCEYNSDDLDAASIVDHPITSGVAMIHANSYRGGAAAKPDAIVLASWVTPNPEGGVDPLVGYRQEGNVCVVGITIFPDASYMDFSGDVYQLFDNSLQFAVECADPGPCGNGMLDDGEICDDGNYMNNDGCVSGCVPASCGDGYTYAGVEPCDDGDPDNTDACLVGCILPTCGDGFVRVGVEDCDDVNLDNTDDCISNCEAASCGDGFLWAGVETCDDGDFDNTDDCPGSCQPAVCGDGYPLAGVEPCDDGNAENNDDCLVGCVAPSCGDGFIQPGVEACDDANQDDTDTCVGATCSLASCGDGFIFAGFEECDDGNATPGDGCTACQLDDEGTSSDSGASAESSSDGGMDTSATGDDTTTSGGDDTTDTGDPTNATDPDGTGTSDDSASASATLTDSSGGDLTSNDGGGSDSSGGTGNAADPASGCSCTTDDRGGAAWLWLPVLAMIRRRRR